VELGVWDCCRRQRCAGAGFALAAVDPDRAQTQPFGRNMVVMERLRHVQQLAFVAANLLKSVFENSR